MSRFGIGRGAQRMADLSLVVSHRKEVDLAALCQE
jgi:hypothetical protein